MSPTKKKPKLLPEPISSKRSNDIEDISNKRRRTNSTPNSISDIAAQKRKNFVKACEKVSCSAYLNYAERLQLLYLPNCAQNSSCKHQDYQESLKIKQIPSHSEELFKIEMKSNMWYDALEVCRLCITPTQYLSSDIMKDIVEIILNAHEDSCDEYTTSNLIKQCQQILALNFSTHPPCLMKSIRKCYNNFLTTAMDLKENTFTNRSEFECDKGIVKYCMNRLEYEISAASKDEALVDKNEHVPEEMKQSVKGLHWQKEKFEIFELLERSERIERLMCVLQSIIELLQFDLAIWHSRYTKNLGCHIMRSHKPLMAYVLWSNNVLYTGAVNNNCRQILRLFIYFVHLDYPEEHVKTMQAWLNTVIQTFYICENNSNSDYPNTAKYCMAFAAEFYKIFKDMPHESKVKILEKINPTFMQHMIGIIYLKSLLSTHEENVISISINLLNESKWKKFPQSKNEITILKPFNVKNIKPNKFLKYLTNKCKELRKHKKKICNVYSKYTPIICNTAVDQSHLMHVLFITLQAYLNAYSVHNVQETLDMLNTQLLDSTLECSNACTGAISYTVTESFIKTYRNIYQLLKVLIIQLNMNRDKGELPQILKIFENIPLLGF